MRSTLVSAAVIVVAAASSCRPYKGAPSGAAAFATDERVPPSGIDTRAVIELPNGLRVVLEENHAVPLVAIQAWVHAGGADDPAGLEGLAHLFQHLFFLSTKTRPAGAIARDVAAIGGRIGAFTTYDETVFHALVASTFADVGIGLLADILTEALLSPTDIDAARRAVKDDLRQALATPDRVAAQAALATAFPAEPYGRSLLGTEASLAAISADHVRGFFDRFYVAANATLVIVGDFDSSMVRARVSTAFGSWRAGDNRAASPRPNQQTAPRVGVFTADIPAPQLIVAYRIPGTGMDRRDLPGLEILAAILGPGRGGRLEMEVVRNRQLANTPRAYLFDARDGGMFITTAVLGPGRVDDVARAVRDEVTRLAHERIGSDEFMRARTIVEGDAAFDTAGLDGYARTLGRSMAVAGDPSFATAYLDRLRRLDAGDLMDVAARTFLASRMNLAVVLPAARDPERDDRAGKLLPRLRAVAAATETPATNVVAAGPASSSGRDLADYSLPSGVRLLVLRDDTAPQLSVRAVWSGGLRLEDDRLAGASSLLARLLPRATKTRGPETLAKDLADIAGSLDGVAGIDSLALRGEFLASHWERGLELLVDCVRNPSLADEEVERERRVLLDAIRTRDDDPTEVALRLFRGALFGRHPYRQDLLGTADAVAGLNRRRLLDFYRRSYGQRGLTLAVLGAVEPDRVAAKVQSLFADLRPAAGDREGSSAIPPPPVHTDPTEVFQLIPKAQARVVVGYPGLTVRDPDRLALEVLAEVLGGAAGKLAESLREQVGMMGAIEVVSREGVDPGYFAVYAAARPDVVDLVAPALRAQVRHVAEGGVNAEDVLRARRILIGSRALALERRGAVAMAVALHGAFGETGRAYRRDIDELGKVTAADVARVARRIIDPRHEILAVVRPLDADRTAKVSANEPVRGPTSSLLVAPSGYTSR